MKIAVLLLHCSDAPRVTAHTRDWVHQLTGHVAGYFVDQSGQRENLEFRVFDWVQLPFTSQEWNDFGFEAGAQVKPVVAQHLGVDLGPFERFALVIDKFDAVLAAVAPDGIHVHVGAQSLDPALLAHEFGHFYGANHANLASPDGPVEYGDNFCIMGGEGSKFSFVHEPLNTVDLAGNPTTAFSDSGPGMIAPSLSACGWLDPAVHGVDLAPVLGAPPFEASVELAPLRGAPPAGVAGPPVCAFADGLIPGRRLIVEYRSRDGWDRALPGTAWLVAHLSTGTGVGTSSLQVGAVPAVAGAGAYLAEAQTGLTVVAVDTVRGTATIRLEVERHPALFASIWEQSAGQLWQARHGMGAAQYQQTFTDLVAQGYRLVRVSGYSDAGRDRYAAIWEQRPGPEWHARHGLTPDQYQQSFTELTTQGFRLVDVSGYTSGGQERYAAVWERGSGLAWQARHGLTAVQYQQVFDQLVEQGFRLVRISAHTVGGEDRFAGIWEQRPGPAWQARHGLTAEEYQKVFDELTGQGFRLVDVSGYGAGSSRYAAVFEQVDGPAWQARHGLTSFRHQQEFQQLAAGGMRLVAIDGHNPNG